MEKLVEKLKDLGLNSYESKVYLALLKNYPATGYEVSKISDIPQSRVYDTLKALEQQKIVISDSSSKPITYVPIKPTELTQRYKRKINSTLEFLDKNLPKVKIDYSEPVLKITGKDAIKEKIIEVINNAKKELFIDLWLNDYRTFEPYLLNAYNRGVDIKIVGIGGVKSNFCVVFDNKSDTYLENLCGPMFILTADNCEGIVGNSIFSKSENLQIAWTKNEGIVFLIKEYIIKDMCIIDIKENLAEPIKRFYGTTPQSMKEKVLGLYKLH